MQRFATIRTFAGMLKSVFLLALTSTFCLGRCDDISEKVYYDLKLSENLFKNYITRFQKVYSNEETESRFKVFQENLKMINELNKKHENTIFGLTPFSDLTNEEFSSIASCLRPHTSAAQPIEITEQDRELPKELDYRKNNIVTEVKDQSYCGSCYIFSAIGEIESQYAKKHKNLVVLSESYPLDCSANFTCDGGDPIAVMNWLAGTPGALLDKDYPYVCEKRRCKADPKKGIAKVKKASVFSTNSTNDLKTVLLNHGPLSIQLFANEIFKQYIGGVLNPGCNGTEELNHGVVLVGYGQDEEDYWLIKNSWSSSWGEGGYVRLAVNSKCGVGVNVTMSEVE